jgi:hypothetical protein
MKNDECTIYLITKHGKKQIWRKEKDGWVETSSRGIVRRGLTAEQLVSHLLPPLAFKHAKVVVLPKNKKAPKD